MNKFRVTLLLAINAATLVACAAVIHPISLPEVEQKPVPTPETVTDGPDDATLEVAYTNSENGDVITFCIHRVGSDWHHWPVHIVAVEHPEYLLNVVPFTAPPEQL